MVETNHTGAVQCVRACVCVCVCMCVLHVRACYFVDVCLGLSWMLCFSSSVVEWRPSR